MRVGLRACLTLLVLEEVARTHDPDAAEGPELPEIMVSRDDGFGPRLDGAFEDAVVRIVIDDDPEHLSGTDDRCEPADGGDGILGAPS